jgi:hypothetical protein
MLKSAPTLSATLQVQAKHPITERADRRLFTQIVIAE